jgi:hypothetical protein
MKSSGNSSMFEPRDHEESFLLQLFNDPEFIIRRDDFLDTIKRALGPDALTVILLLAPSKSLGEQLRDYIENSTSPRLNSLLRAAIDEIAGIASSFQISIETVELGIRYVKRSPHFTTQPLPFAHVEGDEIVVRINSKTRLEDVRYMFQHIRELQEQLPGYHPRNRGKERPDLVYAIYKQRLAEKTFKDIYLAYEKGKLPGYDGPATITGEAGLAAMYRRDKPNV